MKNIKDMESMNDSDMKEANKKFPLSAHCPSVQQGIKIADKHGEDVAKKKGHDWEGHSIEGVKVTKDDFTKGNKVNT